MMERMRTNEKVFVAGANGLVGSAVVRALSARGFSNILAPSRKELDLMETVAVTHYFETEQPAYVIVAAARAGGIKANMTYPADFLYENLVIQNNVIWRAYKSGVKKLLFLGSSCIYPRTAPQPIKEEYLLTGALEPTNEGYAVAKIAGMKLVEKICEQFGAPFISAMPTNIYGPGDHFDSERGHVISGLMSRMYEAKQMGAPTLTVWGTGSVRREFLYVDDLADALLLLMDRYTGRSFLNVGCGNDVSIKNLACMMQEVVGYKGKLVFDTTKPDGMPRKLLDISKLTALGWSPKIPLVEGLQKTYAWFLKNGASRL
jgi:GDP-L-fucose synthase